MSCADVGSAVSKYPPRQYAACRRDFPSERAGYDANPSGRRPIQSKMRIQRPRARGYDGGGPKEEVTILESFFCTHYLTGFDVWYLFISTRQYYHIGTSKICVYLSKPVPICTDLYVQVFPVSCLLCLISVLVQLASIGSWSGFLSAELKSQSLLFS